MADVGVWMAASVLEHKLEDGEREGRTETTWNCRRFPKRLSEEGPPHRLFVASGGVWRGYFRLLPDALFNPDDDQAPYALIFDAASWVEIPPVPVRRFRGFIYDVPAVPAPEAPARKTLGPARDSAAARLRAARDGVLAARKSGRGAKEGAPATEGDLAAEKSGRSASECGRPTADPTPLNSPRDHDSLPRNAAEKRSSRANEGGRQHQPRAGICAGVGQGVPCQPSNGTTDGCPSRQRRSQRVTAMILSSAGILEALDAGRLIINPQPAPRTPAADASRECPYNTSSVDLRLGNEVAWFNEGLAVNIDLRLGKFATLFSANSSHRTITEDQPFSLAPRRFVLANTLERVELPILEQGRCLAARVEGRSSFARCGLLVHFTAPTIHAGFKGKLTLELINLGPLPILLYPGVYICQLIVEEVSGTPFPNVSQFHGQVTPGGS